MERIPASDQTVQRDEQRRLESQNAAILARLRQNTCTNLALAKIALKYTSRISDLRKAGHDIRVVKRKPSGICVYKLFENLE